MPCDCGKGYCKDMNDPLCRERLGSPLSQGGISIKQEKTLDQDSFLPKDQQPMGAGAKLSDPRKSQTPSD